MALTNLGSLGTAQSKSSAATLDIITDQATAIGDFVTVQFVTDNSVSTVGATTTHTGVTDSAGNAYTKVSEQSNGTGGANAGVTLSVWRSVHTAALAAGGTITCTRSDARTARAASARLVRPGPGSTLAYFGPQVNTATGVPAPLTISGMTAGKEKLVARCAGAETNAATIDTATAGWTLGSDIGTSGGNAQTNVSTRAEYIIGTAASYTSEPSGGNYQGVSIMFAVEETAAPPIDFTANNLTTGSPALGSPALTVVVNFTASNLTTAAPALGSPALTQAHGFTASNLTTAAPASSWPSRWRQRRAVA